MALGTSKLSMVYLYRYVARRPHTATVMPHAMLSRAEQGKGHCPAQTRTTGQAMYAQVYIYPGKAASGPTAVSPFVHHCPAVTPNPPDTPRSPKCRRRPETCTS